MPAAAVCGPGEAQLPAAAARLGGRFGLEVRLSSRLGREWTQTRLTMIALEAGPAGPTHRRSQLRPRRSAPARSPAAPLAQVRNAGLLRAASTCPADGPSGSSAPPEVAGFL